jgi:stage V sporulation protein R
MNLLEASKSNDWSFELLAEFEREIGRVARHYRLDTYPK